MPTCSSRWAGRAAHPEEPADDPLTRADLGAGRTRSDLKREGAAPGQLWVRAREGRRGGTRNPNARGCANAHPEPSSAPVALWPPQTDPLKELGNWRRPTRAR
jgi:hypothetical protein